MPGGRGTIDEVVEIYIEAAEKVEKANLDESSKQSLILGIGNIIAASVETNYELHVKDY